MKFLVINGGEHTGKDVLAQALSVYDGFEYIEPYTTDEEHSRIWNTPYVKADKMRVLMGENVPLVSTYVHDEIYVYFKEMMSETGFNVLILDDDGLTQLLNNCPEDSIITVRIAKPDVCSCRNGEIYCDDNFDIVIEYDAFISDSAHAIKEFADNVQHK